MTALYATFKLWSARYEKVTFTSEKCTISNRQRSLRFWLVFLLPISQEGKITMSVTVTGSNSLWYIRHLVYQVDFQLSDNPAFLQPVRMGFLVFYLEQGVVLDNHQRSLPTWTSLCICWFCQFRKNEPAIQPKLIVVYRRTSWLWLY